MRWHNLDYQFFINNPFKVIIMKKFYAFFLALAAAAAINAQTTTYSLIGHSLIGWSLENSEAFVETATPGTYELTVADLFGECSLSDVSSIQPLLS